MSLTYYQSSGVLSGLPSGDLQCYSGYPPHRDVPADQGLAGLGPIPTGTYHMGAPVNTEADRAQWAVPHLGPYAVPLFPVGATDTLGRSGFYLHGDEVEHPGWASHGCIVRSPRADREAVYASGLPIEVVSGADPAVS